MTARSPAAAAAAMSAADLAIRNGKEPRRSSASHAASTPIAYRESSIDATVASTVETCPAASSGR